MLFSFEPIYNSLFEIDFCDYDLNIKFGDYYYKISDKYIFFNLNEIEKEIIPLYTILDIIEKRKTLNISISILNKNNDVISFVYFQDVNFIKINKLIDFDFHENEIIKIKVRYKYIKMKLFKDLKTLNNYKRKQKIEKINSYQ